MDYCSEVDLKNYLPSVYIQQLTDDNFQDHIDHEKAADCIRRAGDFIDGYLQGRYPVPAIDPTTGSVPNLIRDLCTRIGIYYLFLRGLTQTVPEALKVDYDMCIRTLVGMQQGKINAFTKGSEPGFFATNKTSASRQFTTTPVLPPVTPSMTLPTLTGQNNWAQYPI
jgi:phage gp36-like protein